MESVILQSPLALLLYGAALFLNLFDRHYQASKGILTVISAAVCVGTTVCALDLGASVYECATVVLVFLLVNMGVEK